MTLQASSSSQGTCQDPSFNVLARPTASGSQEPWAIHLGLLSPAQMEDMALDLLLRCGVKLVSAPDLV